MKDYMWDYILFVIWIHIKQLTLICPPSAHFYYLTPVAFPSVHSNSTGYIKYTCIYILPCPFDCPHPSPWSGTFQTLFLSFLPLLFSPSIHPSPPLCWSLPPGRCGQLDGFVFDTRVGRTHTQMHGHTHFQFLLSIRCSAVKPLALIVWGMDSALIVLQISAYAHPPTHTCVLRPHGVPLEWMCLEAENQGQFTKGSVREWGMYRSPQLEAVMSNSFFGFLFRMTEVSLVVY